MTGAPPLVAWAGGCHLAGYRVGADAGFVTLVGEALAAGGLPIRSAVLQPVPSHHLARMVEFASGAAPVATVLQLGNFETGLTLGSLARRAVGRGGARADLSPVAADDPLTRWAPGPRDHARIAVKRAAHLVLGRQVRHAAVAGQVVDASRAIADATRAPVLVLAPLPCADPVVDGHRRRLERLLADALPADGFLAVGRDELRRAGPYAWADPIHLGADGHRLVAGLLVERLRPIVTAAAPPATTGQRPGAVPSGTGIARPAA